MCLYPRLIKNRKYLPNKKNGGLIPPITDERVLYVPVGCGKCIECCKQKARAWQVRLLEDIKQNKNGKFITFTFSDVHYRNLAREFKEKLSGYDLDNEIATKAMRLFLERWRKEYKKSLRHWIVTELGHEGTEHLHLHGIVWTDKPLEKIEQHWKYGFVWKGKYVNGKIENFVSEQTVNYIIKYIHKQDSDHKEYQPKILTSAGIGKGYFQRSDWKKNSYNGTETREYYKTRTGHKISLPIYFRNKIYTDDEREKLWLQRLDLQTRYVMGDKIDISGGENDYENTLEYFQQKNKRLGYGDDSVNWDRKQYELERRLLKQAERGAISHDEIEYKMREFSTYRAKHEHNG